MVTFGGWQKKSAYKNSAYIRLVRIQLGCTKTLCFCSGLLSKFNLNIVKFAISLWTSDFISTHHNPYKSCSISPLSFLSLYLHLIHIILVLCTYSHHCLCIPMKKLNVAHVLKMPYIFFALVAASKERLLNRS